MKIRIRPPEALKYQQEIQNLLKHVQTKILMMNLGLHYLIIRSMEMR